MRTAFIKTLCELAQEDERIWLLTGDLGFSVLEVFAERFPSRYINVGVAEQNMAGIAAGLAHMGKIPFLYSIANFPTFRCLEQIRNDICYHHANVKIVSVGGGYAYGAQGYTHHGIEDLGVMRLLPGMTVVAPGDPVETKLATTWIARNGSPSYLRLGKANEPVVHKSTPVFELGRAIQIRDGSDVALIATGGMLEEAVRSAELLSEDGVSAAVLSMHTLKPLDVDAIYRVGGETGAIVTLEEHSIIGGLGSAVAEVLAESGLSCRLKRFGINDRINHTVGSQLYLRSLVGDVREVVLNFLGRPKLLGDHDGKHAEKTD